MGTRPVGVLMHIGRQLHVWGILLRPNIIVDADLHHMVYERRRSTIRRRTRKQVLANKVSVTSQLLAQTEPRVPRSFAKGVGA